MVPDKPVPLTMPPRLFPLIPLPLATKAQAPVVELSNRLSHSASAVHISTVVTKMFPAAVLAHEPAAVGAEDVVYGYYAHVDG